MKIALLVACCLAASLAPAHSQAYHFTTIAGQPGVAGTADGTNNEARFRNPSELVVDSSGAIYVSDMLNHAIRKVTPMGTNWVVTTVAGLPGSVGAADGTNTEARFNRPVGIELDRNGNLFVSEIYNHTIRKIERVGADWVATTIAGTVATWGDENGTNSDARFRAPRGMALDKSGRIYVADSENFEIRVITQYGSDWAATTIAGEYPYYGWVDDTNEWAEFNKPFSLAIDSGGILFVTDWGNNAIRQITPIGSDWVTTTIAGVRMLNNMGTNDGPGMLAMFDSPTGIAIDSSRSLYVTDYENYTIRKLVQTGNEWVVSTIGGAPGQRGTADGVGNAARFGKPWGIATDRQGNLFIADYTNHTIRKGTLVQSVPALQITRAGVDVVLSWPLTASNYLLQAATSLDASVGSWALVTNGIVVSGDSYVLTNSPASPVAFYRLVSQ